MAYPLRIGLKVAQQIHSADAQRETWTTADEAGFDHLWPFDHLIALGSDPAAPIFDGWTILGAIAAATKRVRIGLNVTGNLYRHTPTCGTRTRARSTTRARSRRSSRRTARRSGAIRAPSDARTASSSTMPTRR